MTLKLQPLPNIRFKARELIEAINEYRQEKDFDSIELEHILDDLLCKLPRDIIYVEWYDRSQIKDIAEFDKPVSEDTVDSCMHELWEYNESIMDNDLVIDIVNDAVGEHKTKGEHDED